MDKISIVILMVLLCRIFVGKVSKQASYFLWLIVAARLICPVMLPSQFSIFNVLNENIFTKIESIEIGANTSKDTKVSDEYAVLELQKQEDTNFVQDVLKQETMTDVDEAQNEGVSRQETITASEIQDKEAQRQETVKTDAYQTEKNIPFLIWLSGMGIMLFSGVFSYWHLKYKLRFATKADEGVFESEKISSPFVLGVVKPVIYLPLHLAEQEKVYILAHERYHIKRRDYLVKLAAYGLLSVYWFHPLVWVSFYLMSRDMEMSCDEQVLKNYTLEERKAYGILLLNFASEKRFPLPSPLSFGENDVKKRIKQILNYKSPTLWGITVIVLLSFVLVVCCLTDEQNGMKSERSDEEFEALVESLYENRNPYIGDIPADGKILRLLREYYGISGTNGSELQTYAEPYWITISFEKKPDDTNTWKLASVFLALVENCSEFRWEFTAENDRIYTYYVRAEDVEKQLGCENLKSYSDSAEKIAELMVLLEEKATVETEQVINTDYKINKNVSFSLLKEAAKKTEISWSELNQYERQLMEDGVLYRGLDCTVMDCFYEDFDHSGTMDFILHVSEKDENENFASVLYIYMNEDSLYKHSTEEHCWYVDITSGDIDHDGDIELVYKGDLGGNGGSGAHTKGILKYENHTFISMELPGDFSQEDTFGGEAGYYIDIYLGNEENTYLVACEALGIQETIVSEYPKDENGDDMKLPVSGGRVGANGRGFYRFEVIQEKSKAA